MNPQSRHAARSLWVGLALFGSLLVLALLLALLKATGTKPLPVYGQVAPFTLTNQDNGVVTLNDLRGRVWVADIIFTRCPGPCLKMTRQMQQLQIALPTSSHARLVSLTTDPTYDTPQVLKAYAQRFQADPKRWSFLTGPPSEIAHLAIDSLKLTAIPKPPQERESAADLFVHSTIFVVVDKQARLRGVFDTTGEGIDPAGVQRQILSAVRKLEAES